MDITRIIPETGLSKQTIQDSVNSILKGIEDGTVDPIKTMIALKSVELISEEVLSVLRKKSIALAEQYKGQFIYGAKLSVRATPASYDMDGDQEYADLKAKLKDREAYLKEAIKSKSGRVLTDEGEVVEAPAMVRPQGQTIAISFKP